MPIKSPFEPTKIDAANIASKLPRPLQWLGGAALEGLKQATGTEDPNSIMGMGSPLMAAETTGSGMAALKGLYSRVSKVAEGLSEWVHPAKALSLFKNNSSGEELGYRGVTDLLNNRMGPGKIAKSEILSHLEKNPVPDVRVKTLGNSFNPDEAGKMQLTTGGMPQYARPDLNLPGGKGYTESLFKLADKDPWHVEHTPSGKLHGPFSSYAEASNFVDSHPDEQLADFAVRNPQLGDKNFLSKIGGYSAPHFSYPDNHNLLAHTREDIRPDASGRPGKFLQEVQSDWHQAGKEHGYQIGNPDLEGKVYQAKMERDHLFGEYQDALNRARDVHNAHNMGEDEVNIRFSNDDITRAYDAYEEALRNHLNLSGQLNHPQAPPDAPFKDTWPDLTLKKHVMDVAGDPSLDWLGFTKGETQADRYNLAHHISSVTYHPWGDIDAGEGLLKTFKPNGEEGFYANMSPTEIHNYLGHELADKLLNSPHENGVHSLSGIDLQTGGEGMNHFYDQVLPSRLNKILKPFGGGVTEGNVQGVTQSTVPLSRELGGLGRVYDESTGEQLAQALPQRFGMGTRLQNQDALMNQLKQQNSITTQHPAWLAHFTPEMKAEILKKGLPLLSLMGLMQPVPSHDPSQGQ